MKQAGFLLRKSLRVHGTKCDPLPEDHKLHMPDCLFFWNETECVCVCVCARRRRLNITIRVASCARGGCCTVYQKGLLSAEKGLRKGKSSRCVKLSSTPWRQIALLNKHYAFYTYTLISSLGVSVHHHVSTALSPQSPANPGTCGVASCVPEPVWLRCWRRKCVLPPDIVTRLFSP